MNQLDQLRQFSTIVADTSEFRRVSAFAAHDALVTPSHILQAMSRADDAALLAETVARAQGWPVNDIVDQALVRFGLEALKSVAGRVSTLVDSRLSFDCAATVARARRIVALYEDAGVLRERVLIQIVSTWEGVQAARMLEHEGIHCHLTLLFSLCQAIVCADAGVTIVSAFVNPVGRRKTQLRLAPMTMG
jgi:transaldolase